MLYLHIQWFSWTATPSRKIFPLYKVKLLYYYNYNILSNNNKNYSNNNNNKARRAASDGSMSASGSAGPGFDSRRDSKFSFEILNIIIQVEPKLLLQKIMIDIRC